MIFSDKECSICGSKEHKTSKCPHGILSGNKCSNCGSIEHASSDCPHGLFSSKCDTCRSKEHATSDCPHGLFSSKCDTCGSLNHATSDCPHGIFSSNKCKYCGSVEHSSDNCPQDFFASKSNNLNKKKSVQSTSNNNNSSDSGCGFLIAVLVIGGVVLYYGIWLAFNIVIPIALLNASLIFTILSFIYKKYKNIFHAMSIPSAVYILFDINNNWFSVNLLRTINNYNVIEWFVLINSVALGYSSFQLVKPFLQKIELMNTELWKRNILKTLIYSIPLLLVLGMLAFFYLYLNNQYYKF